MSVIEALILGIVQGLTEFLPISSSAHLVLVPEILGVKSSVAFDVFLHLGTLIAVLGYFRSDIIEMIKAFLSSLTQLRSKETFLAGIREDPFKRLAWLIIIGSIPTALMGYLFKDFFENLFSSVQYVAVLLIITGFLLLIGEKWGKGHKDVGEITFKNALAVGIAQGFAIAPGISRSGATIVTGLLSGIERELSARFAFLLAIPAILGAVFVKINDMFAEGFHNYDIVVFAVGTVAAIISGYFAIKWMLKILREKSLMIFAYYCWIVGILVLIITLMYK
ncbi:MAG: undecaprenyl-diphosphatase UppP [Euryarchaeota archaeon]|nr:undecaprenyl-diphosphatase UppP [Euryarchaeota archaeon]